MPADLDSQVFLSSFHRGQHNSRLLTSYVNCNVLIDSGIGDFIKSGDRRLPMIMIISVNILGGCNTLNVVYDVFGEFCSLGMLAT